jgi:dTDP-4-dehydrorhamnose reductase
MKMLVFGATGQVGWSLLRRAPADIQVEGVTRADVDLLKRDAAAAYIAAHDADVVVNAAAYTDVDRAETEPDLAFQINGVAPAEMAEACSSKGVAFIHLSTDYVFDGSGYAARRPNDPTQPVNSYGRSKLIGEQGVLKSSARSIILRTSWVFSGHGNNFLKTMLRLGMERDHLKIVADQIGGPTNAADIADAVFVMARRQVDGVGVYHYAGQPEVSWADFGRTIFECAGFNVRVEDIPSVCYPTPTRRPLNSRLDCSDVENVFGLVRPDWRSSLRADILEVLNGSA